MWWIRVALSLVTSYSLQNERTPTSHNLSTTCSLEVVTRADRFLLGHTDGSIVTASWAIVQAALLRVLLSLVYHWATDRHWAATQWLARPAHCLGSAKTTWWSWLLVADDAAEASIRRQVRLHFMSGVAVLLNISLAQLQSSCWLVKLVCRIWQDQRLVYRASRSSSLHTRLYCLLGLNGTLFATHLLAVELLLGSKGTCRASHLRIALESLQVILARAKFHCLLFLLLKGLCSGLWLAKYHILSNSISISALGISFSCDSCMRFAVAFLTSITSHTHHLDKNFLCILQALEQRGILNLKLLLVWLLQGTFFNFFLWVDESYDTWAWSENQFWLVTENHLDNLVAVS